MQHYALIPIQNKVPVFCVQKVQKHGYLNFSLQKQKPRYSVINQPVQSTQQYALCEYRQGLQVVLSIFLIC